MSTYLPGDTGKFKDMTDEQRKEYYANYRKANAAKVDGYHKKYREENREKVRKTNARWRKRNPEQVLEIRRRYYAEETDKVLEIQAKRRAKNKARCVEYMGTVCKHCGTSDKLHYHHVDPSTKEFNVGRELNRKWKVLKAELDKCIVLCASCHSKHHAKEQANEQLA